MVLGTLFFLAAAFLTLSLALGIFGIGFAEHEAGRYLYRIGTLLTSVYGICSIFVPVFLLASAFCCFSTKWSIRIGFIQLMSVFPFFTAVMAERICKTMLEMENNPLGYIKISVLLILSVLVIGIEFLAFSIIGDMLERKIQLHAKCIMPETTADDTELPEEPAGTEEEAVDDPEAAAQADAPNDVAQVLSAGPSCGLTEFKGPSVFDAALSAVEEKVLPAAQEEPAAPSETAEPEHVVSTAAEPAQPAGIAAATIAEAPAVSEEPAAPAASVISEVPTPSAVTDDTAGITESAAVFDPQQGVFEAAPIHPAAELPEVQPDTSISAWGSTTIAQAEAAVAAAAETKTAEEPAVLPSAEPAQPYMPVELPPEPAAAASAPAVSDAKKTPDLDGDLDPDFFDIDMNAEDEDELLAAKESRMSYSGVADVFADMDDDVLLSAQADPDPIIQKSLCDSVVASETLDTRYIDPDTEPESADDTAGFIPAVAAGSAAGPAVVPVTAPAADSDVTPAADPVPASSPAAVSTGTAMPASAAGDFIDEPEFDDDLHEESPAPAVQEIVTDDTAHSMDSPAAPAVSAASTVAAAASVEPAGSISPDTATPHSETNIPEPTDSTQEPRVIIQGKPLAEIPVSRKKYALHRPEYIVPVDLLTTYEDKPYWIIDEETKNNSVQLKETLSEFKIEAEVVGIRKGPVVTMFELLPAPGVKLSKIVALQDNIALRLAASSVRIVAPIPGKRAVGIEVPNKDRAIVSFKEIISQDAPAFKKMAVPVILGKDIQGEPQIIDLVRTPHLLIAGATGAGKSVCVNSMILSILYKRSPQEVKLILIDPKIVELKLYNDIPHLMTPVITQPKRAIQALQYCLCEMERRYALLDGMGVRDISSYNKRIVERKIATEKLPYIIVIIDEFADLMATTGKEMESTVARLAAMSRAIGIHIVLATQRPSIDVITGLIKANIPSRIAFMVSSKVDSRIIIDQVGAEKLLGRGDMLYASATDPVPVRIQGTFISDNDVESVVDHVKTLGEPEYIDDEMFVDDEEEESEQISLFGDDGEDPLYEKALDIVIQAGKASASYIQRRLKIGYNRAARLVEEMEERGIVGPQNGSKAREVIHMP